MKRQPVDIVAVDVPASRFDVAIESLMIGLLAFMPLALGAVAAWGELVVILVAGAMALCLALKVLFRRNAAVRWSWTYVPLGLFLILAVVQLIPLPAGIIGAVSPNTAQTRTWLLADLPEAGQSLRSMTLSFYPLATQHDLRLALAVAAIFVVVVNVYRRPDQVKRLLGAIVIIGAAVALLSLAQIVTRTSKIYWLIPSGHKIADGGPFVNHSHFSQFMCLSIGAALGLLFVKLHEAFETDSITLPGVMGRLGDPALRPLWYLAGMIVISATAIFLSLSRGGMISMLIAGGLTALVLTSRRAVKGRGWTIAVMALGAFICVLYIGFDAVYDRLASLRQLHEYEGRWQILKDLTVSFKRFPTLGTGLGTHEVVYPMFDRSTIPKLAAHAENEYAQLAEETGIVGLALVGLFGGMIVAAYVRCIRRGRSAIRSAAFGLGFGLVAIMIHSLSDFGQHLPANACLSAVCCGLLVGLARMGRQERAGTNRAAGRRLRPIGVFALIAVCAVWAWATVGANDARRAEAHWKRALRIEERLGKSDWLARNEDYADLISHAAAASSCQPGNVKYRHWLNVYRWRSISRVSDPSTGEVVTTPATLEFARRIVRELHQARALCPTFGPTYCVVGQLERFVLKLPGGAEHIRKGHALAPADATACFVAGRLDAWEGDFDASLEKFRHGLEVNAGLFRDVVDVYVRQVNRPDLAEAIAADRPRWLLHVANALNSKGEHQHRAARVRAEAVAKLRAECEQSDASAGTLAFTARICVAEKDYRSAAEYYRRALKLDYGQVDWRLARARALAMLGRNDVAMHEARVCLRLRPQMTAARRLIEKLRVLPAVPQP